VEQSQRDGTPAHLIDCADDIEMSWLSGVSVVGVTTGASALPAVVSEIVTALSALGTVTVTERIFTTESVVFGLPRGAAVTSRRASMRCLTSHGFSRSP
jgi:4-hydroxy-3-methylbut-2-en-1-yl diphosphate reductase